ncbi:putative ribosomal protein L21 [Dioscorea sansibarensis]
MATRRCLVALSRRHLRSLLSSTPLFDSTQTLVPQSLDLPAPNCASISFNAAQGFQPFRSGSHRFFSSPPRKSSGDEDSEEEEDEVDDDEEEEEEEEEVEGEWEDEDDDLPAAKVGGQSGKTEAEKVKEAAEIGYKVIGPLDSSENPFKPYEPVFAVVQIGSHQFKVSNGDSIFTERLKFCDVNDKLILNRVLLLGSNTQTIVGRPILPDAAVHAVVEEHALDAKVIIFKKKRRKNYRRTKGHRQELTKLRITDIQGIDKSENTAIAA